MNEFDSLVNNYFQNMSTVLGLDGRKQFAGYIDGEERYKSFLTDLNTLGFSFYSRSSITNKSSRILFICEKKNADINIPYCGSPFQIVKSTYLSCSQDGRYDPKPKDNVSIDEQPSKKHRGAYSKKIGCPSFMSVKCLRIFNEECYKLNIPYKESCRKKNKICKRLHEDLLTSSPPTGTLRFMIVISPAEEHNHKIDYSNLNQTLHPTLRKEIYNLVNRNVCCVETIKIVLNTLVKSSFENPEHLLGLQPDSIDRCFRYYPSDQVIRFHIYHALFALKKSWHDQESLEECISARQEEYPGDNVLFRPFQVLTGSEEEINLQEDPKCCTFLFCHQTKWQCDLLNRYGNDISLLDTPYKTCKYNFPLYFITVKTNTGFCVVGTFIVQRGSAILIEEALSQFIEWNPDWKPDYFMTDYSEAEIEAIKQTFPETIVYVSAFHRDLAWYRWLNRKGNVAKEAASPLKKFWQAIATSQTETEYMRNLEEMYDSHVYQSSPFAQRYFLEEWLPFYSRWVEAYYTKDFRFKVNINNGVDSQSKCLLHSYLTTTKCKTLTGIVKAVLEDFLPDTIDKYTASNTFLNSENKRFKGEVPEFLQNRPIPFIESVMLRFEKGKEFDVSEINTMGDGLFMVRSEVKPDEWYPVDFQEASCSCLDFSKWGIPCKHMCAVFIHTTWGFEKLPAWYRDSPYITIDTTYSITIGINEGFVDRLTFVSDTNDLPIADMDFNQDGMLEEQYITVEKVDIDNLWEEFRESLKTIEGYSYLQHNVEDILNFTNVVRTLKGEMLSSATKSDAGILLLSDPDPDQSVLLEKLVPVKLTKEKCMDLSSPQNEKHTGQYEIVEDQWCQWNTDTIDDCDPMAVDHYVEIDMV